MNNEFLGNNAGNFFNGEYHPGTMNQMPFQPEDGSMFVQPQGYFNDITVNPDGSSTFVQPQGYFNHITVNEMPGQNEFVTTSMDEQPVYAMTSNTNGQQGPMPMSNELMGNAMSSGYPTIGSNSDPFDGGFGPGLDFGQPFADNAAAATNNFFGNLTAGPVELRQQSAQQGLKQHALRQEIAFIVNENEQLRMQLAAKTKESDRHATSFNTMYSLLKNKFKPSFDACKQRAQKLEAMNGKLFAMLRDSDTVPKQSFTGVWQHLSDTKRQLAQKIQECEFWKAKAQQLSTSPQPPFGPKPTVFQSPARQIRKSPVRRNQKPVSTAPANVPMTAFRKAPHSVQPYTQPYEVRLPGVADFQKVCELPSPIDLTNDEPETAKDSPSNSITTPDSQATAETGATSCSSMDASTAVINNFEEVPCESTAQDSNVDANMAADASKGNANPADKQPNGKKPYAWCVSKSGAPGRFNDLGLKGSVGMHPLLREKEREKEKKGSKKRAAAGQTEGNAKAAKKRKGGGTTTKPRAPQASAPPKASVQGGRKTVGESSSAQNDDASDDGGDLAAYEAWLIDDLEMDAQAKAWAEAAAEERSHGKGNQAATDPMDVDVSGCPEHTANENPTPANAEGAGLNAHVAKEVDAGEIVESELDIPSEKEGNAGETVEPELDVMSEDPLYELFGTPAASPTVSGEED